MRLQPGAQYFGTNAKGSGQLRMVAGPDDDFLIGWRGGHKRLFEKTNIAGREKAFYSLYSNVNENAQKGPD